MITLLRWWARRSLAVVQALGAFLGILTHLFSPSYRRRLTEHAGLAGLSGAQRRRAVLEAGRMAAELPWLWLSPPERRIGDWVRWEGAAAVEAALADGRGLVLLTPHLGSFEVCAQAYAERFGSTAPITALYRPARKAWLRTLEEGARARPGLCTAPASLAGVRQMIRALRRGETVGLLPDQVPPAGLGVWAPFFGRPAYTMTLASRLLEQTGATLLLMWAERRRQGQGWCVRVYRPQELMAQGHMAQGHMAQDPASGDVDPSPVGPRAVWDPAAINGLMEGLIRLAPEQYLWGYHRYKQPRPISTEEAL